MGWIKETKAKIEVAAETASEKLSSYAEKMKKIKLVKGDKE